MVREVDTVIEAFIGLISKTAGDSHFANEEIRVQRVQCFIYVLLCNKPP